MTFSRRAALILMAAFALVLSASTTRAQAAHWPPVIRAIHHARNETWKFQRDIGHCCRPYGHSAERSHSRAYQLWVLRMWTYHWHVARAHYAHMLRSWLGVPASHVQVFLCIHQGEGAWNDDTGNGFYGGLQFAAPTWDAVRAAAPISLPTMAFEATPEQQIYAANFLVYSMGASYSTQWPNTSPGCV